VTGDLQTSGLNVRHHHLSLNVTLFVKKSKISVIDLALGG
jgi:hypothetical protein